METSLLLDHQPSPTGHVVRALLRVEAGPAAPRAGAPLSLALVLDRSGSMHGPKLAAARDAAALLARRLRIDDLLAVVAYDDRVETVATPARGDAQADLADRILRIQSGGSTNLSGGWLRGRELIAAAGRDGRACRILLLTDGLANVGITDPDRLVGLAAAARAEGIRTTTIGFGADYDERLLRAMADAGGGQTWYIERPDQAASIFAAEFDDLATLAAQNLAITVRPGEAAVTAVHHTYPRTQEDGVLRLDLGDLYAREPRSLLVELLVESPTADVVHAAELTVMADAIREDGSIAREEIRLPVTFSPAEGPRVDPEIRRELLLLSTARAREEALRARESGDLDGAAGCLSDMADHLADAGLDDDELRQEATELREMRDRFAEGMFSVMDAKYMHQRAHDRGRGNLRKAELIRRKRGGSPDHRER